MAEGQKPRFEIVESHQASDESVVIGYHVNVVAANNEIILTSEDYRVYADEEGHIDLPASRREAEEAIERIQRIVGEIEEAEEEQEEYEISEVYRSTGKTALLEYLQQSGLLYRINTAVLHEVGVAIAVEAGSYQMGSDGPKAERVEGLVIVATSDPDGITFPEDAHKHARMRLQGQGFSRPVSATAMEASQLRRDDAEELVARIHAKRGDGTFMARIAEVVEAHRDELASRTEDQDGH